MLNYDIYLLNKTYPQNYRNFVIHFFEISLTDEYVFEELKEMFKDEELIKTSLAELKRFVDYFIKNINGNLEELKQFT